jgi:hypothetical protein
MFYFDKWNKNPTEWARTGSVLQHLFVCWNLFSRCMTKYLLKSSPKNEQKQDSDLSSNEIAFQNLIHEINDDLVVHKKVFRMTLLLEKYKAYLPADTDTYSSAKLQAVVINSFQNKIVTIQHANQSIIILTQCALHQLVHTLTVCNFMYFKITKKFFGWHNYLKNTKHIYPQTQVPTHLPSYKTG